MSRTLTSTLIVSLLDKVSAPARNISKSLTGITKSAGGIGKSLGGAIERNNAALANARGSLIDAAAGYYALKTAIGGPIQAAMKFESGMADLQKVSNFDDEGLKTFSKTLRKIASSEIPMALDELTALATEASKAGVGEGELEEFTKIVAKSGVAWDMSGADAGEALAKIRSALGLTNGEISLYADAINHLGDNLAASERNIIDYARRVVSMGEFFGFAKEETIAFGTAMVAAGAEPEVAATSFRNMGKALTKGSSATKRQSAAFKTLGMDSRKVAKAMQKDAVGTTLKVIEKLGSLPEHMQASVMSDLFGDEARALAPLLKNTELLKKALGLVSDETKYAGSVQNAFAKRAATSEYAWQRFKSQMNNVAVSIGATLLPALVQIGDKLGPIVNKLAAYAEAHPELVRNIVAVTAALVGFKIAIAGLKFVGLLGRGGALSLLSIGYRTLGRSIIFASTAAKGAVGLQTALGAMAGMKLTGFQTITTGLRGIAMAIPGVAGLSGIFSAIGAALATVSAPVWAGVAIGAAVVGSAGILIYKYWDRISSFFSGVGRALKEQLAPALEYIQPMLEPFAVMGHLIGEAFSGIGSILSDAWEGVKAWLGSLFTQEVLSEEAKKSFENAGHAMMTALLEGIKAGAVAVLNYVGGLAKDIGKSISSAASNGFDAVKNWFGGGEETPAPAPASAPTISAKRARGGPVWTGGSFLVGEREPEIFTPKTGGTITPASEVAAGSQRQVNNETERRPQPASFTFGDIIVQGATDPMETAKRVRDTISDEINKLLRGAHSDGWAR